jgi:hypothetical protein
MHRRQWQRGQLPGFLPDRLFQFIGVIDAAVVGSFPFRALPWKLAYFTINAACWLDGTGALRKTGLGN